MDIIKLATEWTKDEILASKIFMAFGILFIISCIGLWQYGKADMSKALIYPNLVVGILLLAAGLGFYFSNSTKLSNIEDDYRNNPSLFVQSEIERTEKTMSTYENVAFKVFPAIIILAALIFIFVQSFNWRAISIAVMAFFLILVIMDSLAHNRLKVYHEHLEKVQG